MKYQRSLFMLLLLVCNTVVASDSVRLSNVTDQVRSLLNEQFSGTAYNDVQQLLLNLTELGLGEAINGSVLVDSLEKSVRAKLSFVETLLKESLAVAEQSYFARFESPCCSCVYNSSKTQCKSECNSTFYQPLLNSSTESNISSVGDLNTQYSELFQRNVSFEESAVHVPGDIYYRDPRLICFVDWTANLTQHFRKQSDSINAESGVTYQYFGGTLGALRFFPGTVWSNLNNCSRCPLPPVDTYRATERPWYSRTVPGSKFVAIVLDMSGSMSGFRLLLAKLASIALLDTLTPKDYFYVVGNQSGEGVVTGPLCCSSGVTRATPENVLAMGEVIMGYSNTNLTGKVDFSGALELVFKQFNDTNTCHHIVVIFTDQFSDKNQLKNVLESLISDNKARVYTYIVGQSTDDAVLREIASLYGGDYYRLQYYIDIHQGITNFTDALRSLTSYSTNGNSPLIFWNQYKDVFGDYVLTGSVSLFVDNQDGCPEFLGVMGVDINLSWLENNFRRNYHLTSSYYTFMMDLTGELLFHPQIKKDFISMSSADDVLKLDMRQYEHAINDSELEIVRQSMLNGKTGEYTVMVWLPLKRERRYVQKNVTYYYKQVEGEQLSVAVAIVDSYFNNIYLVNATEIQLTVESMLSARGISLEQNTFLQFHGGVVVETDLVDTDTSGVQIFPHNNTNVTNVFAESERSALILRSPIGNTTSTVLGKLYTRESTLHQNLSALLEKTTNETIIFLLDGSGYIVAANTEDYTPGTNLFVVFPSVLQDLVSKGVYVDSGTAITGYELQPCMKLVPFINTCGFTGCIDNAGFSVYKGFLISLSNWVISFISDGVWMAGRSALLSAVVAVQDMVNMVTALKDNRTVTGMMTSVGNYSKTDDCPVDLCLIQFVAHELQIDFSAIENANVTCKDNEELFYEAVRIPDTNLLLLSVNGNCSDWSNQDQKYRITCPCDATADDNIPNFSTQQCFTTTYMNDCSNSSPHTFSSHFSFIGIGLTIVAFILL